MISYIIKPGDTLSQIASRFGTSVNAILAANLTITDPNRISVGAVINIPITVPAGPLIYTLQPKDTLYGISTRFGVAVQQIILANPNINPLNLMPGVNISVPLPDYSMGSKKIYNILGSTNALSAQQVQNMARWRDNAVKLANANPEWIIVNGPILERKVCLSFDDASNSGFVKKIQRKG